MNQCKEFDVWWNKNKPNIHEEDPCIKSYAERAWDSATETGLIAKLCVNEDVAEKVVRLLLKDDVKCRDGVYKITVCRVSDGRLCNG